MADPERFGGSVETPLVQIISFHGEFWGNNGKIVKTQIKLKHPDPKILYDTCIYPCIFPQSDQSLLWAPNIQQRLQSDCANAQVDRILRCMNMSFCRLAMPWLKYKKKKNITKYPLLISKSSREWAEKIINWTASSEFGTYRLCEQRRFRRACSSAQSRQNLRCSLIQAVSQEEPSDRKPDPWPL